MLYYAESILHLVIPKKAGIPISNHIILLYIYTITYHMLWLKKLQLGFNDPINFAFPEQ